MKKLLFLLVAIAWCIVSGAQYWQQQTNYNIDVTLNDKDHSLKGNLTLEYINNSPETLTFIWFHLWPNAYKDESTAYAKQIFRDAGGKKRWKDMKDHGFIDGLAFTVDGKKAATEASSADIDVIKLLLPAPLKPGEKAIIKTPFLVKIPSYSSRSGHIEQSYIICQWYPKPAVFDRKGWHPMPYLDQGEFYSEFGNFDVKITVPSAYVVGASGTLQDAAELQRYKELGKKNNADNKLSAVYTPTKQGMKTLQYKMDSAHDFAWFADKEFIIRYDTAQLTNGRTIDVFTYGHAKGNKHWQKSVEYVEDAVRNYSKWVGIYPYSIAQAVEGPANVMSGGMEYPTITLITSPDANGERMDAVITHEVGHNWFYGIIGSDERDHAWMDEGINTYYQFRYEAEKYKANSIFGDMLPADVRAKPLEEFVATVYGVMASEIPMEEPIETHSANFPDKDTYGMVVYLKTAIWLYIVELQVGKEKLDQVIQAFYDEWKFKHPYPEDLKATFEKVLKVKVDDIWKLLDKKGKFE